MKKILAIMVLAGFLASCNDTNTNQTQTDTATSTNNASVAAGEDTTGPDADTATTKPAGLDTTGTGSGH